MAGERTDDEREAQTTFAKRANGEAWALLEKPERTVEETETMIRAAHASLYHWSRVGTPLHQQRGEWLLSRVYAVAGRAEQAGHHARRCADLTRRHADLMQDFDRAYAEEALARASALAGDEAEAARRRAAALRLGSSIDDGEDRKIFLADLESGPW